MRATNTHLYYHVHTATWDRLPLLTGGTQVLAYRVITEECIRMRVELLAIGGMPDHVHVLAKLPPTITVADFAKQWKGSSAHLINRTRTRDYFKWQGSYAAKTVSPELLTDVRRYIENQEQHQRDNILDRDME